MGLAASQARLLFLTRRLSDLELRAEVISNAKIRLADQSTDASKEYTRELDRKKFQVLKGVDSRGNNTYWDATAENLTTYNPSLGLAAGQQRFIKDSIDRMVVTNKTAQAYQGAMDTPVFTITRASATVSANDLQREYGTLDSFLKKELGYTSMSDYANYKPNATDAEKVKAQQQLTYLTNAYTGKEGFINAMGYSSDPSASNYNKSAGDYYAATFDEIKQGGYVTESDENMRSKEWLDRAVNAGYLRLYEPKTQSNGTTKLENISWTSGDTNIQEVEDTTQTAKAEAQYEATMAQIQAKDKKLDVQLKQIDTEHQATQTTIDSVKKIIEKNIDRSFKMFQA